MLNICTICGKNFTTSRNKALYCPLCKTEANRRSKAKQRAKDKEIATGILQAERKAKEELEEKQRLQKKKREEAKLKRKIANGDIYANMMNEFKNGGHYNKAYWKWYRLYLEQWDKLHTRTVNGISIYCDNFESLVVDSIRKTGRIKEV